MTAPARWAEVLAPVPLELRLQVLIELSRAGVLETVGFDLQAAVNAFASEEWRAAERIVSALDSAPADDGWSAWTKFCAESNPVAVDDYRSLLEERYGR